MNLTLEERLYYDEEFQILYLKNNINSKISDQITLLCLFPFLESYSTFPIVINIGYLKK